MFGSLEEIYSALQNFKNQSFHLKRNENSILVSFVCEECIDTLVINTQTNNNETSKAHVAMFLEIIQLISESRVNSTINFVFNNGFDFMQNISLINFGSCGTGGYPILARSKGRSLLDLYTLAPFPFFSSFFDDFFKLGFCRTDFEELSRKPNVQSAVDIVFYKNQPLAEGTIQFMGSNLYQVIQDFSKLKRIEQRVWFAQILHFNFIFDVKNSVFFFVSVSFLSVLISVFQPKIFVAFGVFCCCNLLSFAVVLITGYTFHFVNLVPDVYFSLVLYGFPSMLGYLALTPLLQKLHFGAILASSLIFQSILVVVAAPFCKSAFLFFSLQISSLIGLLICEISKLMVKFSYWLYLFCLLPTLVLPGIFYIPSVIRILEFAVHSASPFWKFFIVWLAIIPVFSICAATFCAFSKLYLTKVSYLFVFLWVFGSLFLYAKQWQ